jgi:small subunit ribosomal protein S8
MLSDPIADMLTRIRNGAQARKASVDMPWSRHKEAIAKAFIAEGYLGSLSVEREGHPVLRLELRYDANGRPVISGLARVSRPSLRVYVGGKEAPSVQGGLGVSFISTPKGMLPDREARRQGLGGEVVCKVW